MDYTKLVKKVTAATGFTRHAGVEVVSVETGEVHMALSRKPELLQFNRFFHGGVISGLADHAAGAATTTKLPEGKITITIDMHVNFLAPADDDKILAKARALQVGHSICVASVEIINIDGKEEGKTCAIATVTLRVVDMPDL